MSKNCFRGLLHAGIALSILVAGGCGNNASKQAVDKADKALELFLDAWSRGEPPNKFADSDPLVQGSDPDWKAGYRLLSFLSAEAKQSQEMPDHVRCRVTLSLQDPKGKKREKEVVYDVRVGEKCVISRVAP